MLDPLPLGIGICLTASCVAGPPLARGLDRVAHRWRRTVYGSLLAGCIAFALLASHLAETRLGVAMVHALAALPGLLAFLAFRTLLASSIVSLAPLYFVIGDLTRGWSTNTPSTALDLALPVRSGWAFVYGSLYVFIVLMPLLVVRQAELYRRAMQAYLLVMLIGYAGFLLYPTVAPRPAQLPGDGFAAWSLRTVYAIDPPHGCFPSLHVAYSFVSALTCYRVHRGVGAAAGLWAALIGVSTLYTKQHYVVDVLAGALAAFVAYGLFLRTYPRDSIAESDRRRAPLRAAWAIPVFGLMLALFWAAYRMGLDL